MCTGSADRLAGPRCAALLEHLACRSDCGTVRAAAQCVGQAHHGLLRDRDFRRFFVGQLVSLLGDQASVLAIPLTAVLVLHAGAAQLGLLTAADILPSLFFSLWAGAWIDRRGRRRQTMLVADAGRAVAMLSLPIA